MDAEHPLFLLYTSGSTGKPKGVLHTTGPHASMPNFGCADGAAHDLACTQGLCCVLEALAWLARYSLIITHHLCPVHGLQQLHVVCGSFCDQMSHWEKG